MCDGKHLLFVATTVYFVHGSNVPPGTPGPAVDAVVDGVAVAVAVVAGVADVVGHAATAVAMKLLSNGGLPRSY